jgi:uncharacterized membrane protein
MPSRVNRYRRLWRHLITDHADLRRVIGDAALDEIEAAVQGGERRHTGEIRVAFEPALAPGAVLRRMTARERALEVFGALRVWDTEANNGVLLYVLLADKAVEIIADRGAARAIAQPVWDEIARDLSKAFAGGTAHQGCLAAVARLDALLADAFALDPRAGAGRNPDELPDRPAVL